MKKNTDINNSTLFKRGRSILLLQILCLFSITSHGQEEQLRFKHFSVEDGLSQSWVKSILQDSYGYLWFGTGGSGINKYNGYQFKVYKNNARDSTSLSNNWITSLYEDRNMNLWIGSQKGISRYDPYMDQFIRCRQLQSEYCLSFFENGDRFIYVLTQRNIFRLDPKTNTAEPLWEPPGCGADAFIGSIISDSYGNNWVGSSNGLYKIDFENKILRVFRHDPKDPLSISDNDIESVYKDFAGRIWIGTVNSGLCLLNYSAKEGQPPYFTNYRHNPANPGSIASGRIRAIMDDGKGKLWVGIENGGLDILHLDQIGTADPKFSHFVHNKYNETTLAGNSIHALYKDNQETIWIGTYGNGISYYNKYLFDFEHYKHEPGNPNSLGNDNVNVIFKDTDGSYWIGTEGGITHIDSSRLKFTQIISKPNDKRSLGSDAVWAIHKDRKGRFWFGTWAGGLNLYDPATQNFTLFLTNPGDPMSLGSNNIFGITEDENGILWLSCMNGGLNRFDYDHGTNKIYREQVGEPTSISGDWVSASLISSTGEFWVSTSNAVDLFDREKETFIHFVNVPEDSTSISYNGAAVIFEDSKKNIWLGTEGGLNCFIKEDSSFICYREEDGLPNNFIKGICEDDHGNLWLSSNKGLIKFIDGIDKPSSPVFMIFDINDGLQGQEFNRRSCLKDKDGYMYFGGVHGMNIFHPDSLKENPYIPPVVFTNFSLFYKPVDFRKPGAPIQRQIGFLGSQEIILSYKEAVFSIEYAALSYIVPEKSQYKYMLKGFDVDWHEVGNKHEATYTNLDPGRYKFMVKASNSDGIWNEQGAEVAITILPPWWNTLWAKIAGTLLIISLIIGFYYLRLSQLRAQKIRLQDMVEQRTAVIEEKNVILQIQTDELNEINTLLEERQQRIEEQAEELRTQAEELSDSNQNLVKLNATKDKFFSIIAHDLKNPFAAILGFCEVLLLRYDKYDDNKRKHLIGVIDTSAKNIFKLLENLLQWARTQTGSIQFTPEEFKLEDLVNNIKTLVESSVKAKNLSLRSAIPPDLIVFADKNMLYTVIRNFVSNAIKFTDAGDISIEVQTIVNDFKMEITDSGVGIRKEVTAKIFEIEKSKSTEGTRGETGTGLGLIICKEFIEKHGGSIGVRSEPGKGSTFFFTIPKGVVSK